MFNLRIRTTRRRLKNVIAVPAGLPDRREVCPAGYGEATIAIPNHANDMRPNHAKRQGPKSHGADLLTIGPMLRDQ